MKQSSFSTDDLLEDKNILKEIKKIVPSNESLSFDLNNLKSIMGTLTLIKQKYLPNYETTDFRNVIANHRAQLSTLQISDMIKERLNFIGLFSLTDNIKDLKFDLQS